MSTYIQLYVHLIFSTKNRERSIETVWKAQLHAYMAGICSNLGSSSHQIGGIEDHVHLLISLPKAMTIANFVKQLKRASTRWIQTEMKSPDFKWQEGYGAFSVSTSNLEQVISYIKNQELHHKRVSFIDEYAQLLNKIGLPYDHKYFP